MSLPLSRLPPTPLCVCAGAWLGTGASGLCMWPHHTKRPARLPAQSCASPYATGSITCRCPSGGILRGILRLSPRSWLSALVFYTASSSTPGTSAAMCGSRQQQQTSVYQSVHHSGVVSTCSIRWRRETKEERGAHPAGVGATLLVRPHSVCRPTSASLCPPSRLRVCAAG